MVFYLSGAKKFVIGGILFAAAGIVMGYGLLSSGEVEHPVSVVILSGIVTLFGLSELWIAYDMKRNGISADSVSIPAKYQFFIIGYLFTAAGSLFLLAQITFGFVPPEISARVALWLSTLIFLVPGVFCLATFFRHMRSKLGRTELEKKEAKIGSIIGAMVGGATIYGMVVAFSAVFAEKIGAGTAATISIMCSISILFFYLAYRIHRFFKK